MKTAGLYGGTASKVGQVFPSSGVEMGRLADVADLIGRRIDDRVDDAGQRWGEFTHGCWIPFRPVDLKRPHLSERQSSAHRPRGVGMPAMLA
jgi:hypothetical protein